MCCFLCFDAELFLVATHLMQGRFFGADSLNRVLGQILEEREMRKAWCTLQNFVPARESSTLPHKISTMNNGG